MLQNENFDSTPWKLLEKQIGILKCRDVYNVLCGDLYCKRVNTLNLSTDNC